MTPKDRVHRPAGAGPVQRRVGRHLSVLRCATPRLNEDTRQHQRFRVFQVALQRCGQLVELDFSNQFLIEEPTPCVLHELKQ